MKTNRDSPSNWTPTTNVFVNYIPKHWTKTELIALMSQYGNIESAKVMIDLKTGASKCFGFVRFSTIESAVQAVLSVNGLQVGLKRLLARFAGSTENTGTPTRRLFIKSLPLSLTRSELYMIYSQFGSIEDMELVFNPSTQRFTGAAYITFSSILSAKTALRETNNLALDSGSWPLFIRYVDDSTVTKRPLSPVEVMTGIRIERRTTKNSIVTNSGNPTTGCTKVPDISPAQETRSSLSDDSWSNFCCL